LLESNKEDKKEKIEKRNLKGDKKEEITDEENKIQIRKIKKKKARGIDGIENKA